MAGKCQLVTKDKQQEFLLLPSGILLVPFGRKIVFFSGHSIVMNTLQEEVSHTLSNRVA